MTAHPRSIPWLLAAAAASLAGAAQAQVQIYGTIDAAVGQIETQPPGAPNARIVTVRGVHSGALQTSYIGFRGSEDLGDGLRARFVIEAFMRVDTGQNGRFDASPSGGADAFWGREAFVALGNAYGEVRLGNNGHPTWVSAIQTNALGANSVFSPSFRQLFNGGARGKVEVDTSMVNSVKYVSPVVSGVEGSVALQAGEGSGTRYNASANLSWRAGPVFISAAATQVRHAAAPNFAAARDQDTFLLGGAYDFGVVRLFAQYVAISNDRLRTREKVPNIGLTAPMGAGQWQLSTARDTTRSQVTGATTAERTTSTLGYVHALSKRTDVYSFVMRETFKVYGPPAIAFDDSGSSYVVGVRHRF